jgi:hypothetical protein
MSETPMKVVVDCSTGESVTIPLSEDELAQREVDRIAYEAQEAERLAEQEAKEKAEASAIAKLTKLGLTADEISALKG